MTQTAGAIGVNRRLGSSSDKLNSQISLLASGWHPYFKTVAEDAISESTLHRQTFAAGIGFKKKLSCYVLRKITCSRMDS